MSKLSTRRDHQSPRWQVDAGFSESRVTWIGFLFKSRRLSLWYEVYLRSFNEQREELALDVTAMRAHSDAEIDAAIAQV